MRKNVTTVANIMGIMVLAPKTSATKTIGVSIILWTPDEKAAIPIRMNTGVREGLKR